jgi:hypothetical protein
MEGRETTLQDKVYETGYWEHYIAHQRGKGGGSIRNEKV